MKKNWKTLFGKCIYQNTNNLKVYDNYFYRWLTFNSPFIQTLVNKFRPHKPELQYIQPITLASRIQTGNTCILGLGGGGLIHYLQTFDIKLDVVEIDKHIIYIAKKYFKLKPSADTNIINACAAEFILNSQQQYQHLIIDIHDSHTFPSTCMNFEFFLQCSQRLNQDGVLAINLSNNKDRELAYKHLYRLYPNKIISIPISGYANTILLASSLYTTDYILNDLTNNTEIKRIQWDREFGYVLDLI